MKNLFFVILFILGACSKKTEFIRGQESHNEVVLELAPATINLDLVDSEVTSEIVGATAIDFGSLDVGSSAKIIISFVAKKNLNNLDFSGFDNVSPFNKVSSNCKSSLMAKRRCAITLSYSAAANAAGTTVSKQITFNNSVVYEVKASVNAVQVAQPVQETGSIVFNTNVDLGNYNGKAISENITVTNLHPSNKEIVVGAISNEKFSVVNHCSSSLRTKRGCQISVSFNGPASTQSTEVGSFSINGNIVQVSATMPPQSSTLPQEDDNFVFSTNPLNFGNFTSSDPSKVLTAYLTNLTSNNITGLTLSALPSGLSVVSSNCATLASKRRCAIKFSLNPNTLQGSLDQEISISNSNIQAKLVVKATIPSVPPTDPICSSFQHIENGACVCDEGYSMVSGSCVANSVSVIARQMLPLTDASSLGVNMEGSVYIKNKKEMYSVVVDAVAPHRNYLMRTYEDPMGNLISENVYELGYIPTNASAVLTMVKESALQNKPEGNYIYLQARVAQNNSNVNIIKVNLDNDSSSVIFSNLTQSYYALDLQNNIAYTDAYPRYLRDQNGEIIATFDANSLYSKGMLSGLFTMQLSHNVVFHNGRLYLEGRQSCSSGKSATLYYCDLSDTSPNSCSSTTEPFVKILGSDIKDPSITGGAGIGCSSNMFGPIRKIGNKIFFEATSTSVDYSALYSYNLNTSSVSLEAYNNRYINSNNETTAYNTSVGYIQEDYYNLLATSNFNYFSERKTLYANNVVEYLKFWYINPVTGDKELLEEFSVENELSSDVRYSGTDLASIFFKEINDTIGLTLQESDSNYIMYARKSKARNEVVGGYTQNYYDFFIYPYYNEIVMYNAATGVKAVSPEYLLDQGLSLYKLGYKKTYINNIVTSFSLNSNIFSSAAGPSLNFDEDVAQVQRNDFSLNGAYSMPNIILNDYEIFNYKRKLDESSNIFLSFYLAKPQSFDASLSFVDITKNSSSYNSIITSQGSSSIVLNASKITTKEPYNLIIKTNNPTVVITPTNNGVSSDRVQVYSSIDYKNWDGAPITLTVEYKTNYSERTKNFSLPLNLDCNTGASYNSSQKECVCSDTSKFYNYSSCSPKCTDGTWNDATNTCNCNISGWVYTPGPGPNGQGGTCTDPNANQCGNPWEIYDEMSCNSCGYYWDYMFWQCM